MNNKLTSSGSKSTTMLTANADIPVYMHAHYDGLVRCFYT